ncbi:MAG: WYL domain-containing transcriptional regulator [Anaerolineae bacterium]|nr:WYL domain-containing transcriptional regulator [Gloeobacterales cyanobacterium ES-bin-313]
MSTLTPEQLQRLRKLDQLIRTEKAITIAQIARDIGGTPGNVQGGIKVLRTRFGAPLEIDPVKGFIYSDPEWLFPEEIPTADSMPVQSVAVAAPEKQPIPEEVAPAHQENFSKVETAGGSQVPSVEVRPNSKVETASSQAPPIEVLPNKTEIIAIPIVETFTAELMPDALAVAPPTVEDLTDLPPELLEALLKIDQLIRNEKARSIAQLARALSVGTDTIHRTLHRLRQCGAPIVNHLAKGFIYTDPDWQLPAMSLSAGELYVLMLGNRMLSAAGDTPLGLELQLSLHELVKRLPRRIWVDAHSLLESLDWQQEMLPLLDLLLWQRVNESLQNHQAAFVAYDRPEQLPSAHKLNAYALYFHRGVKPYVIGYCQLDQEILCLALDRISEFKILDETFTMPVDFQPREYITNIQQSESQQEQTTVVQIRFLPSAVSQVKSYAWQNERVLNENEDGSLTVAMSVADLHQVKRWVLSFGKEAIVEAPKELITLVLKEMMGMAAAYGAI